ncbi:MAG: DoxX family membrane protein [Ignavibacteriales bacterium]|nr:DoxX family membrane protein [Ignavibacteriales bacterium]
MQVQIKQMISTKSLLIGLRIFFGAVFLFSAIMKFTDLNAFAVALGKFKMLNEWQLDFLSYFFPIIEVIVGMLLITNIKTNLASNTALGLLSLFTAVIIAKIFEGEEVSCGCFGSLTNIQL